MIKLGRSVATWFTVKAKFVFSNGEFPIDKKVNESALIVGISGALGEPGAVVMTGVAGIVKGAFVIAAPGDGILDELSEQPIRIKHQ